MGLEITVKDGAYHDEDVWYPGTVLRIEETNEESQYGPGLKWIIGLDDDAGSDYPETWAFSSQSLTPRTKTFRWLTEIYGRSPAVGMTIDLEKLFGVRVGIQFAPHPKNPDKQIVTKFKGLDEPRVARPTTTHVVMGGPPESEPQEVHPQLLPRDDNVPF